MGEPLSAKEVIVREARIFQKKRVLLDDPDFVESNAEALAALDRGERGMTLEEFRLKHPHPRK